MEKIKMNLTQEELAKAIIYQQCIEDIKAFYEENKFAYEAQKLGEELDEFLEQHFKKQENIIINGDTEYDL